MVTLYKNGEFLAHIPEDKGDIAQGISVNGVNVLVDFTGINGRRGEHQVLEIESEELGKPKTLYLSPKGEGEAPTQDGLLVARLENSILVPVERTHGERSWTVHVPNNRWQRA